MTAAKRNRYMIGAVAMVLAWSLWMAVVHASPGFVFAAREGNRQDGHSERRQFRQQEERREHWQREDRREGQRPQRLSPDERRQLRRDIRDAGREIYPARR